MKFVLKNNEKLSSNQNYQGLTMDQWTALNQGKSVELESVPELCKNKLEQVKEKEGK